MSKSDDEPFLAAVVKLEFLDNSQLDIVRQQSREANLSPKEIAIRRGFLNRQQLEILESLGSPKDVAPGYRIEGLIGKGGAGVVYLATQLTLNRPVALKTINQSFFRKNELAPLRFEREARIVGQLRHHNIVSAFDFGLHKNNHFLVMEFVDGIDAQKYLEDRIRMPEFHAWHVARQVCHALSYASDLGIIHRDIKPANLILSSAPKGSSVPPDVPFVKIADFGLARFKEQTAEPNITIDASSVSGTPFYMSPEQVEAKDLDHHSDIYSLGVTVWHLITGHPPITGTSPLEIVTKKMKQEDEWLETAPHDLSTKSFELLREMCRFRREDRFGDYTDLISKIDNLLEHLGHETQSNVTQDFVVVEDPAAIDERSTVESIAATNQDFSAHTNVTYIDGLAGHQSRSSTDLGSWSSLKWGSLATVALIGVSAIFFFWNRGDSIPKAGVRSNDKNTVAIDVTKYVPLQQIQGPPIFLFNGLSVDPRQKFSGTWEVAVGADRGAVLAGLGTRDFKCIDEDRQPIRYYRFECGFRHQEAEQIEFRLLTPDNKPFFNVVLTLEKSVLFAGESEIGSLPLASFDDASIGYHQIQIGSHPEHWRVSINGNLIGVIPKPQDFSTPPVIQIETTGTGEAHFETIRFLRFLSNK